VGSHSPSNPAGYNFFAKIKKSRHTENLLQKTKNHLNAGRVRLAAPLQSLTRRAKNKNYQKLICKQRST
jgi:hypothetical protein